MTQDYGFDDFLVDDAAPLAPPSRRRSSPFVAIPLGSRGELEAAVYALRMIDDQDWHARLLRQNRVRDDDVLTLVGLESSPAHDGRITPGEFREALGARRRQLEARFRSKERALDRNIAHLGNAFKLNTAEREILRLAAVATQSRHFRDLISIVICSPEDALRAIHSATGLRPRAVATACAPGSFLLRSGLLADWRNDGYSSNPLELSQEVMNVLSSPNLDETQLLRSLVKPSPPATLSIDDYSHVAELPTILQYIADSVRRTRRGVNVLIHGEPGTGKTELVRAIAGKLGADLHEVPNEDSAGDSISGRRRFSAYGLCQNLLASRPKQLLLFDEVEDVFGSDGALAATLGGRFSGRDSEELRKSWINQMLEQNPVPAFWVCNSIGAIDHAYLRRFDLVLELASPPASARRRIVRRYFKDGELSAQCVERLAAVEALVPAFVEKAARVAKSLRCRDLRVRDAEVERHVTSMLKAAGHRVRAAAFALPEHYDAAFLNTDRDLGTLVDGLRRNNGGARLCLYGPPGTGKTAFAHHLGQVIDRSVLVKRGSDLMSPWVGGTERNIADAFRRASDERAILVIDEADGFLRDRAGAARSWEVTQVNELLTQMEAFDGIFVASTNLVDTLDAASLRRFDFKVKFDWLTREQRRAMLTRICGNGADVDAAFPVLENLDQLVPGDFANVLRQLRVTGEPAAARRVVQLLAQEVAMKPTARSRRIGFLA